MASGMEEITGQIDKINFKTLVTREGVPFAADLWGVGSFLRDDRYFKEVLWGRLGGALKKNYGVIGFAVNYDMDNVANCAKDIIDQAGRDPKALLELALKGKKLGSDLEEFTFKIKHTDFSGTTDKKLISLFGQFLEKFSVFSPYFIVPLSVERHLQETIREGLKDLVDPSDDINSVLIELTSPPEHDAMYNERLDLLKIAEKYGSGKDVSEDIEKHIDEFGNVCIRWCMGEPWTHDELMEKVEGIKDAKKQISRLAAEDRRVAADFKRFEKEHPDRKELIEFIKVAKWYVWLRTYRTQVLSGSIANIYPLLSEIGRRRGLSLREILCYVPEEILSGKILSREEIKKRKEAFADLLLFGKRYIFSGRDAKFLIDYWQKKHPVASEIKGTVANKPVDAATGTVKIVLTIKDTEKVKPGDILVAAMTEPNFIHAMERASAFITDEGGILCHAAIVGREMNKPCIIGTGNATKVLKDGDTVSMDLNTGEVRLGALDSEAAGPSRSKRRARPQEQQPIPQESIETALDTALVVPFEHIRKEHIHIAGGKGANLGEMSQKFPIPSGFCVTVNAYKVYLKESGLEAKIHAMLKKLDVKDNKALDRTSAEIRKMILSHPIPSGVKAQILQGYTRLGGAYVAVRSSATAEDMPNASFAGQQDTYLNIRGEKALLDAVRSCWASLFTSRAIYYRELNKFEHEKVHISVVVQNMIEAEKSGIMFSVNPVTRDRNEMIIEGSFGLGEAIVSGMVTPDSYIIDKRTMKPKEIKINTKRIAIVRSSTGKNEKITLQEDRANARCLTDQELKRLAELATSIERHYGKPQDMEWAIADGQVYILQSRPITTL